MNKKYLLPCRCGRSVPVDSNQAGLSVSCACGETIEVPSLRELADAARAIENGTGKPASSQPDWGPREATVFLGFVLVALAVGMAAYLILTRPTRPIFAVPSDRVRESVEVLTLEETFELWESLRQGLPEQFHAGVFLYETQRRSYLRRLSLSAAIGVVGLLVAGVGMASFRPRRRRPSGRRAPRASARV